MKQYLDLIPISAKVHRKQNRMTRVCIFLAVFLVAVIFGMADMEIRSQRTMAVNEYGSWHISLKNINSEQKALIEARPEVISVSRYSVLNYALDKDYFISGTKSVICGFDKNFLDMMPSAAIIQGRYPDQKREAVVTESTGKRLNLQIGDTFCLDMPKGKSINLKVTGFSKDASLLKKSDVFGIYLNRDDYRSLVAAKEEQDTVLYVKFKEHSNFQKAISDITKTFNLSDQQIGENVKLLALSGKSNDPYMRMLYGVAFLLAGLVVTVCILMITGSLNSSIARRTEFFGMMRCLGASKKQVIRYVRREALSWCKTAIPCALVFSIVIIWLLCVLLKYLSPGLFSGMEDFSVSVISLVAGTVIGVVTVLLAAQSPAKKAVKVSPLTAVLGNANLTGYIHKAAGTKRLKVETALGIHHATAGKKNFLLIVGSFSFSIILFLSFSVVVNFMNHAVRPLKPFASDISITDRNPAGSVAINLAEKLSAREEVKRVYGRMIEKDISANISGRETNMVLVSYEDNQFKWAEDVLLNGSVESVKHSRDVLLLKNGNHTDAAGDMMKADFGSGVQELTIAGIVSESVHFSEEGEEIVICSEETFEKLTGKKEYAVLDVQLTGKETEQDLDEIRNMAGNEMLFSDRRSGNSEAKGAYYAFSIFIYGFLMVIGSITVFHIINSISMSVSARFREYGAMQAIGMSCRQLIKMIAVESFVYSICGVLFGCLLGLASHKSLFELMITSKWGETWYFPVNAVLTVVIIVAASSALSMYGPSKRIKNSSIVETFSAE